MWQKNGGKVNTYLDRQAVSLKIDTIVSTQWHPIIIRTDHQDRQNRASRNAMPSEIHSFENAT
jgi:hypothetical protein